MPARFARQAGPRKAYACFVSKMKIKLPLLLRSSKRTLTARMGEVGAPLERPAGARNQKSPERTNPLTDNCSCHSERNEESLVLFSLIQRPSSAFSHAPGELR